MDLVPGYRELPPPAPLRGTVACLWVRVTAEDGEVRVVPDGCTDVVWQRGAGTSVAGPDTGPRLIGCAAGEVLVGMRFRPGVGGGALGVPLAELRDQQAQAADLDRAFEADGELDPEAVVTRFLAAAAGREADPVVAQATPRLLDQQVDSIARDLGISERQLRRRFHAAAGYGPKTLARVLRFNRFVAAVDAGRSDFAAIAFDAGYADQAHLTREVTRLAGLPPAAFLRVWR